MSGLTIDPINGYRPQNVNPTLLSPSRYQQELTNQVSLPHLFVPRDYQTEGLFRPLFPHHYPDLAVLDTPRKKRVCLVWHRRAGKDKSVVNALTIAAWEDVGNYLYLLPEQTQGRKIVWRGMGADGVKFIDHIPDKIIKKKYEAEMLIELTNGSTIQIGGADNYNSFMGTNPRGIIFSEYAIMNPLAWHYFRPILVENGGWAVFIYTPRGKNHGYDLYRTAKNNPDTWAGSLKTIEDTRREDGGPVVSVAQYEEEIHNGMDANIAKQEFYCDFTAALMGAYYGDLMNAARDDGRIGFYPYDPSLLVYTAYDLGNDANVCVFAQKDGSGLRIIDHYEEVNTPFSEMCKVVTEKPYTYGAHFFPHDVVNRDPEGNTRVDTADKLGIDVVVTPKYSISDGIEAVRNMLPRTRFHEEDTEQLRDAMVSYERVWDDRNKAFKDRPLHNWCSHSADAMRCLAMNIDEVTGGNEWLHGNLEANIEWIV